MKRYKKTIAVILAVVVLLGVIPYIDLHSADGLQYASAQTIENGISASDYYRTMTSAGSTKNVITISNADDLRAYMKIMQKQNGKGKTFVQTADIVMSDYTFQYDENLQRLAIYDGETLKGTVAADGTVYQPVYSDRKSSYTALGMTEDFLWQSENNFRGVYQGNHHRISGLLFAGSHAMFGEEAKGVIVNLALERCAAINTNCAQQALFADSLSGSIVNCIARDCIMASPGHTMRSVGMFVGSLSSNGTLEYCTSMNSVVVAQQEWADSQADVGGIVGASNGSISDCQVYGGEVCGITEAGGIVGTMICNDKIERCYNSALVSGTCHVGGICGSASLSPTISECVNDGIVYEQCTNYDYGEGQYLGGIVGYAVNALRITKCYNAGNILSGEHPCNISPTHLGGILGGTWNGNKDEGLISDSINVGNIKESQHSQTYMGGIAGDGSWAKLKISNVANFGKMIYAVEDAYAEAFIGGILGRGYDATQLDNSTLRELQQHAMTNCVNYGTVQSGSTTESAESDNDADVAGNQDAAENQEASGNQDTSGDDQADHIGTLSENCHYGGLAGNGAATEWQYCYEASASGLPLFGQEGIGGKKELYVLTFAQRAGSADAALLSEKESSYAHTASLKEALNAYALAHSEEDNAPVSWRQKEGNYPTLDILWDLTKSGYSSERLVDGEQLLPTPTPTKNPTAKPTVSPTAKPAASPTVKPSALPKASPLGKPSARPTAVAPTKKPKTSPTKKPNTSSAKKYPAPNVKVVRKKTGSGQRYIQISLRKKQNCYLEFYRKTPRGFQRIKLKNNRFMTGHRKINIAYSKKMKSVTYKVRIYKKVKGNRRYSRFTKPKKIRLS